MQSISDHFQDSRHDLSPHRILQFKNSNFASGFVVHIAEAFKLSTAIKMAMPSSGSLSMTKNKNCEELCF